MSAPTINRADMSEAIHREIGLSRSDAASLLEQVLDLMREALWSGEDVKIAGFGTFKLRDKPLRVGRNPTSGVIVPIEPRRVVTFQPSQKLRIDVSGN